MADSKHILIGEIVAAQGIRGQVRINTRTEDPASIGTYTGITDHRGNTVSLKIASIKGRVAIASISGITDRNAAEKLVGTKLYVAQEALPREEGEVYFSDLKGLEVRTDTGKIGAITAMHNFGAGDIMEIALDTGKTEMLPYNKQIVKEANLKDGYVLIDMPDIILAQG